MLYIDSYVTLRYVTFPLLFFSLVDCGYYEEESFEVSTKESRKKRERELQVTGQLPIYRIYTLPYLTLPTLCQKRIIGTFYQSKDLVWFG